MNPDSLFEPVHGDANPPSGKNQNRYRPSMNARLTLFHLLWMVLAFGVAVVCYVDAMNRGFSIVFRILESVAGGIVGFFVGGIVIFLLVTRIVIPGLKPGSAWSYEVNCYMSQMLGKAWDDLDQKKNSETAEPEQKS